MVHIVDLLPTFAKIGGASVPTDRAIDGIDESDFLLGKREKAARDGSQCSRASAEVDPTSMR